VELRVERGRAVLVGAPELFEPPTALAGALHEWAEVAAAVCAHVVPDQAAADVVSARGRQLAARLAAAAGIVVSYHDPVRGVYERLRPPPAHEVSEPTPPAAVRSSGRLPAADHLPAAGHDAGTSAGREPGDATEPAAARGLEPCDATGRHGSEPTPWATGLVVSALVAAVVVAAVGTLVSGLAGVGWWLGGFGLVVVTAGLMPSVWLTRSVPLWRWVSYGVAGGLAISWLAALLAALGP
jgi:hypothetical protein